MAYATAHRDRRLTLWALRRAATPVRSPFALPVMQAAALYRAYLETIRPGGGTREPRLALPGSIGTTRDERCLLRAVAAARAGDERLLDNRLYKLALDRSARTILAHAVRAWVTALTTGLRDQRRRDLTMTKTAPRPHSRLPIPETALLWAIRSWVRGRQQGVSAEDEIARIFASLGAPEASGFLFGLMWVLDHAAGRRLTVHCPCHASLSADERALLDVLALTQEREDFERLLLLRTLVRPMATMAAGQSATHLVQSLNRAGLFLTACNAPVRLCAFPSEVRHAP